MFKIFKWGSCFFLLLFFLLLGYLCISDPFIVQKKESYSPSKKLRLVSVIRDGGATTSQGLAIYLFDTKPNWFEWLKISIKNPIFSCYKFGIVNVVWISDSEIEVQYDDMTILNLEPLIQVTHWYSSHSKEIRVNIRQVQFKNSTKHGVYSIEGTAKNSTTGIKAATSSVKAKLIKRSPSNTPKCLNHGTHGLHRCTLKQT